MHCIACDKLLNDYEATRKDANTEIYIDMCNKCFSYVSKEIPSIDRPDLDTTIESEYEAEGPDFDDDGDDDEIQNEYEE